MRLKRLDLPSTSVSDADLAHLSNLKSLEWLQFTGKTTIITDEGLAHLRGLVNLQALTIVSSRITSTGLSHLHDMDRLEWLSLPRSEIADLAPIRQLSALKALNLNETPLDDAGLAPIGDLTGMETLYLPLHPDHRRRARLTCAISSRSLTSISIGLRSPTPGSTTSASSPGSRISG